jgi:hypothetical protein
MTMEVREVSTPSTSPESTRRKRKKEKRFARTYGALRRFWQDWSVEIIVVLFGLLAVFLLVEQMDIRKTLFAWLVGLLDGLGNLGSSLVTGVRRFIQNTTLSDLTAYILILIVLGLVVWRTRWRLMNMPRFSSQECPRCGGELHRIRRRGRDRLLSVYLPVRRYQCKNRDCDWQGLRVGSSRHD